MGEFKVKSIDSVETKGVAELEAELIKQKEEEAALPIEPVTEPVIEKKAPEEDLTEEKVLSFIGKRYNKQINSFDELLAEKKSQRGVARRCCRLFKV